VEAWLIVFDLERLILVAMNRVFVARRPASHVQENVSSAPMGRQQKRPRG